MAQRGRPPKMRQLELPALENSKQGENVMAEEGKLKIIARGINKKDMFGTEGDIPARLVEQYVGQYLDTGYELKQVYMIENTPDVINLLFILVRP